MFNIGLVKFSSCIDYIAICLKKKILEIKTLIENEMNEEEDEKIRKRRVKQIIDKYGLSDDKLSLPFQIEDGKVNQKNEIRYHNKSLNEWTTALRYLFTDLKHLILLQSILDGIEVTELLPAIAK